MSKRLTKEDWLRRAKEAHGDFYDYSKVEYKNLNTKVLIIDPLYGEFWQNARAHTRGQGSPHRATAIRSNERKSSTEEFIRKARLVHGDKYDYSLVEYSYAHHKVCIVDKTYGPFWQQASIHLRGSVCKKEAVGIQANKLRRTREQFIDEAEKVHGKFYNYDKVIYENSNKKIIVIDPDLGEFLISPSNHLLGQGNSARTNRISRTSLSWLLSLPNSDKFVNPILEPSLRIMGKMYQVDAYDPSSNTVFQFHGSYWHGWNGKTITNAKRYERTLKIDEDIINSGYKLVTMWEHDWHPTIEDWRRVPSGIHLTEQFIIKSKKLHGDLYDYSKTKYINNMTEVCLIHPEFGEFWYRPDLHLKGCIPNKFNLIKKREKSQRIFIERAKNVHGDSFDYSKVNFVDMHKPILILEPNINIEFYQTPYNHLKNNMHLINQ